MGKGNRPRSSGCMSDRVRGGGIVVLPYSTEWDRMAKKEVSTLIARLGGVR